MRHKVEKSDGWINDEGRGGGKGENKREDRGENLLLPDKKDVCYDSDRVKRGQL